jgi:hypothetical protein
MRRRTISIDCSTTLRFLVSIAASVRVRVMLLSVPWTIWKSCP